MSLSVSGLVSGLDVNNIISELMAIQQRPIVQQQRREADYQVKLTAYGALRSALDSLKSVMEDLDDASDLTSFSATSGDAGLFTVSAGEDATAGSYNVTVQQLAEAHKLTSAAFSDVEAIGEGTIHLKVANGDTTDISVSATDTIEDVAQAINDVEAGVHASVIFDGTDYFLTLTADETGAENVINLTVTDTSDGNHTDLNGLSRLVYNQGVIENLTQAQEAKDSIITVDGVTDIHRDTNTIDDVIDSVTITLKSAPASPDNEAALTVSRDTSAVISNIDSFVNAYNDLLDFFSSYQSYDQETETAGILLGDGTTNMIYNRLRNFIRNTVPGVDGFSRLSDLGIALNGEGRLEVDSSKLNDALDDHFDEVILFFTQTEEGPEGFAVRMFDGLEDMLDSRVGSLAVRKDGIQNSIDHIHDQVERIEMRILAWESRTRAQFNALEVLLSQYQATGDYLSQQIVGLQNLNSYISNR